MDRKQYIPVAYKAGISTGTTITSSSASQSIALPADATGNNPKRCVFSTVSGSVHIRIGAGAQTALASDLLIGVTPFVLDTTGCDHFGVIQESAAAKVNVAPVES